MGTRLISATSASINAYGFWGDSSPVDVVEPVLIAADSFTMSVMLEPFGKTCSASANFVGADELSAAGSSTADNSAAGAEESASRLAAGYQVPDSRKQNFPG